MTNAAIRVEKWVTAPCTVRDHIVLGAGEMGIWYEIALIKKMAEQDVLGADKMGILQKIVLITKSPPTPRQNFEKTRWRGRSRASAPSS